MKKVLHITPHLSTGGLPQFLLSLLRSTQNLSENYVVEYACHSHDFVVQRNQVIDLMQDKFYALPDEKSQLLNIIRNIKPDVIHFQEFPEYFMDSSITKEIYDIQREYVIIETSHDSSFSHKNKVWFPDRLALISQYQINEFTPLGIPITLLEADIVYHQRPDRRDALIKLGLDPQKIHILNVGLWTSRKNQKEVLLYAKKFYETFGMDRVQFHCVGNMADNFYDYWSPLVKSVTPNVKVWGERSDVENFYSCMDIFLFTSRGNNNDKETSPLVLKEAIGWKMPIFMYNLPVYLDYYNKFQNINYLGADEEVNAKELLNYSKNMMEHLPKEFEINFEAEENKIWIRHKIEKDVKVSIAISDIDHHHSIYCFDYEFTAKDNYWIWTTPIPKHVLEKIDTKQFFRGYKVEFYNDKRNLLLEEHNVWVHPERAKAESQFVTPNVWNLSWMNYVEMFIDKYYDVYDLSNVNCALDMGANDGLFTEYLLSKNISRVYCFEPDPRCIEFLNYKYFNRHDVVVVDKAVYFEDATGLDFFCTTQASTTSALADKKNNTHFYGAHNEKVLVGGITLDTFRKKYNCNQIDLIKMDIEGAEYGVLDSLKDEEIQSVDRWLVEFHENKNGEFMKLVERFLMLGFEVKVHNHTDQNKVVFPQDWNDTITATMFAKKMLS
jgi:FkbM family methyltransferase